MHGGLRNSLSMYELTWVSRNLDVVGPTAGVGVDHEDGCRREVVRGFSEYERTAIPILLVFCESHGVNCSVGGHGKGDRFTNFAKEFIKGFEPHHLLLSEVICRSCQQSIASLT